MRSHVRRIAEIPAPPLWDVRPDGAGTPGVGITEVTESKHRSGTSTVVESAAADGYEAIGQEASGVQSRRMVVRGWRCTARACRTRSADSWCRHRMLGGLGWSVHVCYPLTASRSVFPALNDGVVAAAMAMLSLRCAGSFPPGRVLPSGERPETRDSHWLAPLPGVADGGSHGANHPVGCGLGQRHLSGDIGGELGSVPGACCSPFIRGFTPPTTEEISLDEIERIYIGPNVHIWTSCRM